MELYCEKMPNRSELKHLKYIIDIFDRITYYEPALPLFKIDWNLTLKTQ